MISIDLLDIIRGHDHCSDVEVVSSTLYWTLQLAGRGEGAISPQARFAGR